METMASEQITIKAPAKVNLSLDITGRREDGYHLVRMLMQSIDLCDEVTVTRNNSGLITLDCDRPDIPTDSKNIAYRCAAAFFEETEILNSGVHIDIVKQIPMEAGLGGGSADGAAVLVALNVLFGAALTDKALCRIGVKIGADIPFCIIGGTMLAEGVGDIFTPLPHLTDECWFVLAKPQTGVSTAEAYKSFDVQRPKQKPDTDSLVAAIVSGHLESLGEGLCNVLEEAVDREDIRVLKEKFIECGALGGVMSGSGSCVFGLFDSKRKAAKCQSELEDEYGEVFLCSPLEQGASAALDEE